ncbi:MFS transporter [Fusarium austroafricanum]|uniref:MFS transporter n=1 Tax=Fusarium austroafricanum TaxID=2364996 RepID=A0A8H4NRJ8_9HYPO|nr:MFS transporter [Fusarium austroafricanum]
MGRPSRLTDAEKALHDQTNYLPRRQLISCLAMIASALFISFMDQNGISTAIPAIANDLNAHDTISWAGTASLLANATFQMLYGRLSDIYGRKAIFISAVLLLSLADLLCGLSVNATMFYVFRGIAGIGIGGVTNLAMIIVSDVVTLEQRGKYQGITGSMVGLGSVVGPFLASAFATKATWRGFFWLLAPLGAVNAILAYLYLPSKGRKSPFLENAKKIDWAGSFTSTAGTILLFIPISGGGAYFAWNSSLVISLLAIGSVCLIVFVFVEWKFAKLPMMPVGVYRDPVMVVLLVQSFLMGYVYQVSLYYTPLYLQNARQISIIMSAVILVPMYGVQSIVSTLSGFWISKYKRYDIVLRVGFGLWTLGAGLTLVYGPTTSPGIIVIPLIIMGMGVGCVFQPTLVALQAYSSKSRRAVVISNRNFNRCVGGACGLAISAAVLQSRYRSALPLEYSSLADTLFALPAMSGGVPQPVIDAYMEASRAVFITTIPLVGISFLGTFFVKERGLSPRDDVEPQDGGNANSVGLVTNAPLTASSNER